MELDIDLLKRFEAGLNPQDIQASAIPAELVGYGEISAIFQIGDDPTTVYKRMPLFNDRLGAEKYEAGYHEYCDLLRQAGLHLPDSKTAVVQAAGRPVCLYIAQEKLPSEDFGHRLIHSLHKAEVAGLFERVIGEVAKTWRFNAAHGPQLEIAVDGQISNWVLDTQRADPILYYIDTSTPFIRRQGIHELDPQLILKAAPVWMRWLLEKLFVNEVLNRYYDARKNMTDLAANLIKEQCAGLVPLAVKVINRHLPAGAAALAVKDVESYYREDRFIWSLFLGVRRLDRWMITRLLRRRYEFILPGKIER